MNIQGEICMANLNTLLNLLLMHVFAFAKLLQNENANYKKRYTPKPLLTFTSLLFTPS